MANEVATRQKTGIATYLANDKVKNQITSLVGEKATPTFIEDLGILYGNMFSVVFRRLY